jgi:hypothetical protein
MATRLDGAVCAILSHQPVNPIAPRRQIADAVIDAGRHPL